tara:strand:+ start:4733 stop:5257 length:525 start_codon:yes stop_codon:yes gene_type:complete
MKHYPITFVLALFLLSGRFALAESRKPEDQASSRVTISLAILPSLSIDTISDVHFDIERRDVDANYEEFFCVKGNASTRYSIIAYGSSSSQTSFSLTNKEGDELRYAISYNGQQGSIQYDQLSPGKPSPVYAVLADNDACDGQPNFNIQFLAADLEAADSGLYSGALTLVVAPV